MRRFASDRVQGLMRTLGFTDDTALESKMVSRTIENAQTRVEGYNFDTRKHVVEYDDVINRQRETIYRERDRILRSSNLGPTVEAMLDDEVAALVGRAHRRRAPERLEPRRAARAADQHDPDADRCRPRLPRRGARAGGDDRAAHRARPRALRAQARRRPASRASRVLERLVLLRVIDSLWVEHLTAVDDMRRGIGLRAYSQRDPLNEFKIEAYRMFDELKSTIRHDVTHTIFRVTVQQQPARSRARWRATSPRAARRRRHRAGRRRRGDGNGRGRAATREPARAGPEDRPQRPVLVRLRQEVQEVPRGLIVRPMRAWGGGSAQPARQPGGPVPAQP